MGVLLGFAIALIIHSLDPSLSSQLIPTLTLCNASPIAGVCFRRGGEGNSSECLISARSLQILAQMKGRVLSSTLYI